MKKNNLFNTILFFITLSFSFVSCNNSNNKKTDTIAPRTFSFYSADMSADFTFDDDIAKIITEKTGVTLEFISYPGSPEDSVSMLMAKSTYPDFIYAKGDMTKLIEKKAVIPLDELIEKYGSNLKKLYGNELVKLRYTLEDPQIYTVGTYEVKTKVLETSGNLQLQNAVLKEFGYPKIKTLEDYENIIEAYIKKYPKINGKKTIGFSLMTDNWYWYLSLSNPGNYVIGYPDDGQWIVDQDTMKVTYKFLHPKMYIFYKWLNHLYNKGLLDPESFTQNNELWESKLKDGIVLGTSFPLWGLKGFRDYLTDMDMSNRTFAYLPVTADLETKDPSLKDYGFSGGWGIGISKDCSDPVAAFKFLDWMSSEEAQILINWGIEGEHYFYDGLGRRISRVNIHEKSGVGKWLYPFPQGGSAFIDSTGNPLGKYSKENIIKTYNYSEKETLKAYDASMWIDLFPSSSELGPSRHGQMWQYPVSSSSTNKINQIDEFVKRSLINMISGSEADFMNAWIQMQDKIKSMGIDEIENQMTQLIEMKQQLWKIDTVE